MTDAIYDALPETVRPLLDQDTFDIFDFVTGDATPADQVVIYADRAAGWDLNKLVQREKDIENQATSDGLSIADDADWVDPEELAAVKARVEAGKLTFHLKALAPALKKSIRKHLEATHNFKADGSYEENESFYQALTYELAARTIVKAVNPAGQVNADWTIAKVQKLEERLDESEFARLDRAVFAINADGDLYEAAVSADFLSKR